MRQSAFQSIAVFLCLICVAGMHPVRAQTDSLYPLQLRPARLSSFDRVVLYGVYRQEGSFAKAYYRSVDASSWPLFIGGPVVAWAGAWWIGDGTDWDEAYRLTLSGLFTTLAIQTIKKNVTRYRPYVVLNDITSRSRNHGDYPQEIDGESFPSGHSGQAFAIATSLSLSYPRWYVIGPAALWATSIALSRSWLGVHFPTDVLAGAMIGAGMAVLVHVLDPYITPNSLLERQTMPAEASMVHLIVRF